MMNIISKGLEQINPRDYYKPINAWGDYMKEFRASLGMSQKEFAEYFGIPVRTLQDWEQGRRKPPEYILAMIKRIWNLEHREA